MVTTVVNKKHTRAYTVDISRPNFLGNPYRIGVDGTREEVVAKFKVFFHTSEKLKKYVREGCKDEILGCYCKPLPCHGDIIAEYLNGLKEDEKRTASS